MTNDYYTKNKDTINAERRKKYAIANNSVKGVIQLPVSNNPNYKNFFTYNESIKFDDYLQAVNNASFERSAEFSTQKSKIYNSKYTISQQKEPYSLNVSSLKPNEGDKINKPFGLSKFYKEQPTAWALNNHTFSYNTNFGPNGNSGLNSG